MSRKTAMRQFVDGPVYQWLRWTALLLVTAATVAVVYLVQVRR